jgi:hypothetical protein
LDKPFLSNSDSSAIWKLSGVVADEKQSFLIFIFSDPMVSKNIEAVDVFAHPFPPNKELI